jgi:hypothetical protein
MDRKELREGATKIPEETAIAKYFPTGRNQFAFVTLAVKFRGVFTYFLVVHSLPRR